MCDEITSVRSFNCTLLWLLAFLFGEERIIYLKYFIKKIMNIRSIFQWTILAISCESHCIAFSTSCVYLLFCIFNQRPTLKRFTDMVKLFKLRQYEYLPSRTTKTVEIHTHTHRNGKQNEIRCSISRLYYFFFINEFNTHTKNCIYFWCFFFL